MTKVVGIKFKNGGKLYYFAPKDGEVYEYNTPVVVETSKGLEYAWVAYPTREVNDSEIVAPLKPIVRIATKKDREFYAECEAKKPQAIRQCKEKIVKHGLDMKLVDCEYAFDGSKIVFFFTSASRVDFRELAKKLAQKYKTRIELRQVGSRDGAKVFGGIGPCGLVVCCKTFITEFDNVSVKMAKNQNLSLNPVKISGNCGKLLCCINYENEVYKELRKYAPDIGDIVKTEEGPAKVLSCDVLNRNLKVKYIEEDNKFGYLKLDDVEFVRSIDKKKVVDDDGDSL